MSLTLNFRVVGLYLDFPNLSLTDVEPTSTVKKIMKQFKDTRGFTYESEKTNSGKEIVTSMTYNYSASSQRPDNSSGDPPLGPRTLAIIIGDDVDVSRVWQYYRGAKVMISGQEVDIEFPTFGQPSFTDLSLNEGNSLPADIPIISYSLTWRLVTIDKLPEQRGLNLRSALRRAVAARQP